MEATGTAGNLSGLAVPFELRMWDGAGSPFVSSGSFFAESEE